MARGGARTTDKLTPEGKKLLRVFDEIRKRPHVKVGVIQSEFKEEKKVDEGNSDVSLGEVAVWNEFGTADGRIPERSLIRYTHDQNKAKWAKNNDKLNRNIMMGKETVRGALEKMGVIIAAAIQTRIRSRDMEPNAPATIRKKTVNGKTGDNPLIDTSQLQQSINFEVNL